MIVSAGSLRVQFIPRAHLQREAECLLMAFQNRNGGRLSLPVPVEAILEQQLGLTLEFDELFSPDGEQDILAATFMHEGIVTIQNRLAPENGGHLGQFRFTLAHEIGHWILHRRYFAQPDNQPELFTVNYQPDIICRASGESEPAEIQANVFAAELLLPRALLIEYLREEWISGQVSEFLIECIASDFEVSKRAARIRLNECGLLPKNLKQKALMF